jgi:hypothetical protein
MDEVIENERSIASVMHDMVGNLARIIRAEVRLARHEVTDRMTMAARATGKAATLLVAGLALGQLALGLLLFSFVRGFETVVAPWLAALVVAVGAAAVAAVLLATGLRRLKQVDMMSLQRIESSTGNAR